MALLLGTGCDTPEEDPDLDGDGVTASSDCNDADAAVYPGADELCDDIDNDCDSQVDEDPSDGTTWFLDRDGDGYGDPSKSVYACSAPELHVSDATDCDDRDVNRSPAAAEWCDGIDNNCDGETDEGTAEDASLWYADSDQDGFGDADGSTAACTAPDGYIRDASDCDDDAPGTYPGAPELCVDGVDTDCDELPDSKDQDACRVFSGWPEANHELENVASEALRGTLVSSLGGDVAVLDLNRDGVDDVLVTAQGEGAVFGYLNATVLGGGSLEVADADYVFSVGSKFPVMANVGDVDGDGYDDLAVGDADALDTRKGVVYLYLSANVTPEMDFGDADYTFTAINNDSRYGPLFGRSIAGAGDVDGDGRSDLLVGGTGHETVGLYVGAAWLFLSSSLEDEPLIYSEDADYRFDGIERYQYVGWTVRPAGDVDGGGQADLLVGSLGTWGNPIGNAYLFLGESLDRTSVMDVDEADIVFEPLMSDDGLGHHILGLGDVDEDGLDDILLSAPWADTTSEDAGAVYLFTGASLQGVSTVSAAGADATLLGNVEGGGFGHLSAAGDLDGDDLPDIYVSSTMMEDAYVFLGATLAKEATLDLTSADHLFKGGPEHNLNFSDGAGVDIDGDGLDDLLIGNSGDNEAHLFLASALTAETSVTDADHHIQGENGTDSLGWGATNVGDVDGDFIDDILVGGSDRACLFLSSTARPPSPTVDDADYCFEVDGQPTVSSAGDLDGDGLTDLLFGNPRVNEPGQVFVVFAASLGSERVLYLDADADYELLGEFDNDYTGSDFGSAGDVDGDGLDDLFVVRSDNGCGCSEGVYLLLAKHLGSEQLVELASADAWIELPISTDRSVVSGNGDLDGDGLADLLVSS